ncbi:MAG: subtilisin family serine protease [Chlamydiales bacterium]|jgi:subtilisin family serine protease
MHLDILALLACLLPLPQRSQVALESQGPGVSEIVDEMIIALEPSTTPGAVVRGTSLVPSAAASDCAVGKRLHLFHVPSDLSVSERSELLAEVQARPGVEFAEWNWTASSPDVARCELGVGATAVGCTQAFYDGNPSEESYSQQPLVQEIGADFAHRELGDLTVVVAVIDTGVDLAHPALDGYLIGDGYDFLTGNPQGWDLANGVDDDLDGLVDEAYGHGTHVSSTIALINPNARILPLRVLDSDGNGTAFQVAQAIRFAVRSGAAVINLSLTLSSRSVAVVQALEIARDQGVQVVAAAGNTGSAHVAFPARYPTVFAIASVGFDERRSPFSAYGEAVSMSAPGAGIYGAMPDGQFAWWSGTSMASAVATGSLSLTHSLCASMMSSISPERALLTTCLQIEAFNPDEEGLLGEGRVDLRSATQTIRHP